MGEKTTPEVVKKGGIEWRIFPDNRGNWRVYARIGGKEYSANRKTRDGVLDAIPKLMASMGNTDQRLVLSLQEARDFQEATELLKPYNTSLVTAAKMYVEHAKRGVRRVKFRDASKDFQKEKEESGISDDYKKTLKGHLAKWEVTFGETVIEDLEGQQLANWLRARRVSARSRNNSRNVLATLLSWCERNGMIAPGKSPIAAVPISKTASHRISLLSPEQLTTLLDACKDDQHAHLFCALACLTGIRTAEIGRLSWEDVQLDAGFIEVPAAKAKTAARRLVPLVPRLRAILAPLAKDAAGLILPKYSTCTYLPFSLIARKLIPGGWPSNAGRHSWISYRVALTGDVARTALEAGNSPAKIFSNYRSVKLPDGRLITENLAKEWFGLV
ncbi:hypothetical protein DB346_24250 [Verrucomicrobia bacterium LW23]|nr:hypothetical protein DB346_24250 [Verrucomicrobia bacterium LW23]